MLAALYRSFSVLEFSNEFLLLDVLFPVVCFRVFCGLALGSSVSLVAAGKSVHLLGISGKIFNLSEYFRGKNNVNLSLPPER